MPKNDSVVDVKPLGEVKSIKGTGGVVNIKSTPAKPILEQEVYYVDVVTEAGLPYGLLLALTNPTSGTTQSVRQ